jgi:hypothetical protein
MQLGLWHLILPNVRAFCNDSADERFFESIAMTCS